MVEATQDDALPNRRAFRIVDRDLSDAGSERLSVDWQFGIAYNATLKLCTILLYAEGYRPEKKLAHYRTLQALPLILGSKYNKDADYLDTCCSKRNTAEYDMAGKINVEESKELISFAKELRTAVLEWIRSKLSRARSLTFASPCLMIYTNPRLDSEQRISNLSPGSFWRH